MISQSLCVSRMIFVCKYRSKNHWDTIRFERSTTFIPVMYSGWNDCTASQNSSVYIVLFTNTRIFKRWNYHNYRKLVFLSKKLPLFDRKMNIYHNSAVLFKFASKTLCVSGWNYTDGIKWWNAAHKKWKKYQCYTLISSLWFSIILAAVQSLLGEV